MAQVEIDVPIFERNLKIFNKKGLRRTYSSVESHFTEYLIVPPLSCSKDFVIEATLDKENVLEFQNILKDKGFKILGSKNTYFVDKLIEDYNLNKKYFEDDEEKINKIKAERDAEAAKLEDYELIENDDAKFYFLPYNEGIINLYEFIKACKDDILAYSKEKDITIMLKINGFSRQIEGFFGFNFFDADQKGEVVVDFASNITIAVNFNMLPAAYAAAILLSGVATTKEDLADSDLNVHLIAENLKYTKA